MKMFRWILWGSWWYLLPYLSYFFVSKKCQKMDQSLLWDVMILIESTIHNLVLDWRWLHETASHGELAGTKARTMFCPDVVQPTAKTFFGKVKQSLSRCYHQLLCKIWKKYLGIRPINIHIIFGMFSSKFYSNIAKCHVHQIIPTIFYHGDTVFLLLWFSKAHVYHVKKPMGCI